MPQIVMSGMSFSYPTSPVDILTDVSLSLSQGWYGVVGPNGSGKTTLLKILAGELQSDPAAVQRIPSGLSVRYCPQRVEALTDGIIRLGESTEGHARRLMGQLGLASKELERWPSLSPGERKRWQIGAALADLPDLLLLDEPTNHLDVEAKALMFDRLASFRGIGVLVSHDRDLLDSLTISTVSINPDGSVVLYSGNYSEARAQKQNEHERLRASREKLQSERRQLKRRLDTARRSREKAESGKSTGSRLKGIRDSDARSAAAKGRVASAEQKLGREVAVARRKLDDADEKARRVRVEKEVGRSVFVLEEAAPTPNLILLQKQTIDRGGKTLLRDVDLIVRRDSRVHLRGPNGSGKTTLIEEMLNVSRLAEERVLYLPQELSNELIQKNQQAMASLTGRAKGRLLQIVAALGVPPERLLASGQPSPGEARKLALALGLSRQAWLLILDEPTNHLDLPSIERIEEALTRYSCALLIVSHEERFAESLTNESWTIERGRDSFSGCLSIQGS